jgi:hypothetical protein
MLRTGDDACKFQNNVGAVLTIGFWLILKTWADCAGLAPDEGHYPCKSFAP